MIMHGLRYVKTMIALLMTHRVEEKRLRVELYDRRIVVFNAIRDYMWGVLTSGSVQTGVEQKFLESTQHVSSLFGKDIKCFVDEVFDKSGKLHTLLAMQNHLSGKALEENVDKQNAIKEWFMKEAKGLDRRFRRYLDL